MRFPFGRYRGKGLAEIPDTYLDWIIGQEFFFSQKRNEALIVEITKELATRRKSHYHIEDEYGKTLED